MSTVDGNSHPHARTQMVSEAGGWSVFIAGVPVAADGATFDDAVAEMIEALREYAGDWRARLSDSPNHHENRGLVRLVSLASDEQLHDWIIGRPGGG